MKAEDLYEAMQSVRPEYLEESEMNRTKRRLPRMILIAAVIALSGIGAAAAVWSLRGAARADMGIEQPIPEWKEYKVPAEDEPVREGRPRRPDEPDGEKRLDAVTLDSTLCSGDQLTAYLRVRGIDPETGALLEDRTCYWYIGGIRRDWGGAVCDSLNVDHVAYDADTQTALVRLDVFGLRDVERVYFTLTLNQGLDRLAVYEPVEIPVTPSGVLSTQIDYTHEQGSYEWEMRAVQARVYASHVDIDFEFTPFAGTEFAEGPFDRESDKGWACIDYLLSQLDARVEEALADATLQYRDGRSEIIAEISSDYRDRWSSRDVNGKNDDELFAMSSMKFQHDMSQAVDLSQVESITIGGVTYPLERKEYEAPVPDGPVRKDGPVEKFPETVTLESATRSGDSLTACLRVDGVVPELGAFLNDDAYYWIDGNRKKHEQERYVVSAYHKAYDEDSQTALVEVRVYMVSDEKQVSFQLALGHLGETEVVVAPVEIPVPPVEMLLTQLDYTPAQGSYYGKVRAAEARIFDCHVCIDFEVTPFLELDSAAPAGGNQDKPERSNIYFHEVSDRVEEALADATFQYRDGTSGLVAERIPADNMEWFPDGLMRVMTDDEENRLDMVTFCHDLDQEIDLSQVVSITVGGVAYPLN